MIYECRICNKLVYLEDEFVEHIKETHLSNVEDEVVFLSEMVAFYSDLRKARQQESLAYEDIELAAESGLYCFYGDNGEIMLFTK